MAAPLPSLRPAGSLLSEVRPDRMPTRFVGLDLVRCVALLLVLITHVAHEIDSPLGAFFGTKAFYWVDLGGVGVTIFLFLSGCVLEIQHGRRHIDYLRFIGKRLWRIYPVYYLCLLLGILVFLVSSAMLIGDARPLSDLGLGIADIPLSASGMYALAGRWGGPFITTSWFVGLIVTMYLLFPLLSRAVENRPLLTLACLLAVSCLSRILVARYGWLDSRPLEWFPPNRIFEFSLGIYLGTFLARRKQTASSWGRVGPYIAFLAVLSFPVFLVHSYLRVIIPIGTYHGVNESVAIAVFLLTSFVASWLILCIDSALRRSSFGLRLNAVLSGRTRSEPTG